MSNQFTIHDEQLAYKRYLQIHQRKVDFPNGKVFDWDVVGSITPGPHFCVVFPYNTQTKTVRILKEYAQGPNTMIYTLVAGGFDTKKHKSILETAEQELSEEAQLTGGTFVNLLQEHHLNYKSGISEIKWGTHRFIPYLCLDPIIDSMPRNRDEEELIEIYDMSLDEVHSLIMQGEIMLPSVQTIYMAIDWIKKNIKE
ncbi:hypothetical protein BC833DRAFT_575084 [Globomyces pollinis-pini]|nr:hypothetical protein BC833DRAFT_575084 [Globomyces pollinis-pini]